MAFTYEYPRPALTVDAVVFAFDDQDLKVLLIQRALAPFLGKWGQSRILFNASFPGKAVPKHLH